MNNLQNVGWGEHPQRNLCSCRKYLFSVGCLSCSRSPHNKLKQSRVRKRKLTLVKRWKCAALWRVCISRARNCGVRASSTSRRNIRRQNSLRSSGARSGRRSEKCGTLSGREFAWLVKCICTEAGRTWSLVLGKIWVRKIDKGCETITNPAQCPRAAIRWVN